MARMFSGASVRLTLSLATFVACGAEPAAPPTSQCAWFQQCGVGADGAACGLCNDDNPDTDDRCVAGAFCTAVRVTDTAACEPGCESRDRVRVVQTVSQGEGGLAGFAGARSVALTLDGRHAYVGAGVSQSVSLLVLEGARYRPAGSVQAGPVLGLALTGDELWLVAAAPDGLRLFPRNATTGQLDQPILLNGAFDGVIATADHVVATSGGTLIDFRLAEKGPTAPRVTAKPELLGTRRLTFDTAGQFLYAAAFDASQVVVLEGADPSAPVIDVESGAPGLDHPDAIAFFAEGSRLAVAGYCDSSVAVLDVQPGGTVTWLSAYTPSEAPPSDCATADGFDTFNHPTALAPGLAPDEIAVMTASRRPFALDFLRWTGSALLHAASSASVPPTYDVGREDFVTAPFPPLAPPDPFADRGSGGLIRSGDRLVGVSELTSAVGVVEGHGVGQFVQGGSEGVDGLACAVRVVLSDDGKQLYVGQRCGSSLGVLEVDPARGTLRPRAAVQPPSPRPGEVSNAVAALGAGMVAVALYGGLTSDVVLYDREPTSGELTSGRRLALGTCDGREAFPVGAIGSPDGRDLYFADFQRTGASCIHHIHRSEDGTGALAAGFTSEAVGGAESFAITGDGRHLYVASHVAQSVTALERDSGTGGLVLFAENARPELQGAEFVALSPAEDAVYATSPVTDSVVVFRRDVMLGLLTFVEAIGRAPGVPLGDAAGIAVSPDGAFVFVAAREDDAMVTFRRGSDGRLALLEAVTGGFDWPNELSVSGDGRHIYAASVRSSSVTVFRLSRGADDGCLGVCL